MSQFNLRQTARTFVGLAGNKIDDQGAWMPPERVWQISLFRPAGSEVAPQAQNICQWPACLWCRQARRKQLRWSSQQRCRRLRASSLASSLVASNLEVGHLGRLLDGSSRGLAATTCLFVYVLPHSLAFFALAVWFPMPANSWPSSPSLLLLSVFLQTNATNSTWSDDVDEKARATTTTSTTTTTR